MKYRDIIICIFLFYYQNSLDVKCPCEKCKNTKNLTAKKLFDLSSKYNIMERRSMTRLNILCIFICALLFYLVLFFNHLCVIFNI